MCMDYVLLLLYICFSIEIFPFKDDETWTKMWLTMNKLEMPDMPWFSVEKKRSKDLGRLEC